jgi:uracil DNA glycosylase
VIADWDSLVRQESSKPYWAALQQFLAKERSRGDVYLPVDEVLTALDLTPLDKVNVVILGQDPYPGPGQAQRADALGASGSQTAALVAENLQGAGSWSPT